MLSRVHIENYQSLKDVEVEFGPLTVIYGESNKGKSALIRALQAWAFNQSGSDFVTQGQDYAAVAVSLDDHLVTWMKGSTGRYVIDEGTEAERVFTKIGRGVPEEVVELTNVREIQASDSLDIIPQFGGQFDAPFLLASSKGQAARVLASVTNLDLILKATAACNKDLRRERQRLEVLEGMRDEVVTQLEGYDDLEQRKQMLLVWEERVQAIDRKKKLTREAAELVEELKDIVDELDQPTIDGETVELILEDIAALREAKSKYRQLTEISTEEGTITTSLTINQGTITALTKELELFEACPQCGQVVRK